jgi:alkyldihydroxyacetonephosphate synthase
MPRCTPPEPAPQLSWSGWGDPAERTTLPDELRKLLAGALGVRPPAIPPVAMVKLRPPASRLGAETVQRLSAIVGTGNASAEPEARIRHTRGRSTVDLLRLRVGDLDDAPDLVLSPGRHEEVLQLLRACSEDRVAVVPFGGGTSVVGGLAPEAQRFSGVVALDLRRMNALVELDEISRLAVLEPGLRGPQAEALLAERGYTIGHFPQSFEYATLGGFAAARSSGQASAGYGRFDELLLALRLATPTGTLCAGRAPRSAAGPDLRQLILGSEGTLGVITSLTVQVRPLPELRLYDGWRFQSFEHGAGAIRRLMQDGPRPTVVRVSDELETALNLARPAEVGASGSDTPGCLAIVGYEGTEAEASERRRAASEILALAGAEPVPDAGATWARDRYRGPYLRDALLDAGALVDTLETVTFWSSLPGLYAAVTDALRSSLAELGTPPVVMCHISHAYPAGASLYFTVVCAQLADPVAQWRAAKAAAGEAILAGGGSITHHHGVGTDHREFYEREIGAQGVAALRAVKATLDPAGILNPGVLFEPRPRSVPTGISRKVH